MNKPLAVVALGGNALLLDNQRGTADEQMQNTNRTVENLMPLIEQGSALVIAHGNGPQVGNILMQQAAGEELFELPALPLDLCVAQSQGSIGYMIEHALRNALARHNVSRNVCATVSPVRVDPLDPAFKNPTKRVGRLYSNEQAQTLTANRGWVFKHEQRAAASGFRRVVPSPNPIEILNANLIENLAREGVIVIAAGGGGIPVSLNKDGTIQPQEAVIDKDLAAALMATTIHASELYILTDVPNVYINFGKPNQQKIDQLTVSNAIEYLQQGMFGEGNMAPKIRAAVYFVQQGGTRAIITNSDSLTLTNGGTIIHA